VSYATIVEGLHERFATVTALKVILDHEPTAVHATPLLYSILDGFERRVDGLTVRTVYRTVHWLLIAWQDSETAEEQLRSLVDAIAQAVEAEPKLGGKVRPGDAQIVSGDAGWATVGNTEYRAVGFRSEVVELSGYLGLRR